MLNGHDSPQSFISSRNVSRTCCFGFAGCDIPRPLTCLRTSTSLSGWTREWGERGRLPDCPMSLRAPAISPITASLAESAFPLSLEEVMTSRPSFNGPESVDRRNRRPDEAQADQRNRASIGCCSLVWMVGAAVREHGAQMGSLRRQSSGQLRSGQNPRIWDGFAPRVLIQ
jgi:hypothetical protein